MINDELETLNHKYKYHEIIKIDKFKTLAQSACKNRYLYSLMLKKTLMIFAFLTVAYASAFALEAKPELVKLNTMEDFKPDGLVLDKPIIIFSSREYISYVAGFNKTAEIYWVIPAEDISEKDVQSYKNYMKKKEVDFKIQPSPEGARGTIKETDFIIVAQNSLPMIIVDSPVVVIDVDFFFRLYKSDVKTPKMNEVLSFFKTLIELEWNPEKVVLVKSKDINLPKWSEEFAYAVERAHNAWIKNEFPEDLPALDEIDQDLYYFSQYNEAYTALKRIEHWQKNNPFFYKRLFIAAMRTYTAGDALIAARKAYELDRDMIELYLEGADYLLAKQDFYPAHILIKDGLKLEPWNQTLQGKSQEIMESAYNYYSISGADEQLEDYFKKEIEKTYKK